ncbi:hypothetical protein [Pontibacter roseus]|uniref:hypothetical protein n=1 Tax=Pontibacter roseus TaxID=336989 RepID=UPI000369B520|nr:hypothetical protein [Pontibacter roseus]
MKDIIARIPVAARVAIYLALLAALVYLALAETDYSLLAGLLSGLLFGLLVGELARYLKRRRARQQR